MSPRKYPIIVIDGPDACGKTTWAQEFCRLFDGRYMHLTLRKKMLEHQVVSLHLASKWALECPVVIDRHWISEQIYGGVYRGGTTIAHEAGRLDYLFTDVVGAVYVIAILKDPVIMAKAHAQSSLVRDEMYVPDQRVLEVARGYYDIWHGTKFCQFDIGYGNTVAPLRARHTQAMLYDYHSMGGTDADLRGHCRDVYAIASARRAFVTADSRTRTPLYWCEESAESVMGILQRSRQSLTPARPQKL